MFWMIQAEIVAVLVGGIVLGVAFAKRYSPVSGTSGSFANNYIERSR